MEKIMPQKVRWAVNDGKPAGITTEAGEYIAWKDLKPEVEQKLINQVKTIPVGSTVETAEKFGKKDWIVAIMSEGNDIGHVWFGGNPDKGWAWDGLVRLGEPEKNGKGSVVWQTFQRYSDGSYRRV